jgi:hypothetical protein
MRWFAYLYLASVVYAYTAAKAIPKAAPHEFEESVAPVFEGRLTRMPQSVMPDDQLRDEFNLSRSSVLVGRGEQDVHNLIHFDAHGLIVQANGDGGDTAQRTGMLFFQYRDEEAFVNALDQLEIAPGIYVRHPYQAGFRNDPNRFSRDQQRALVIAMGSYRMDDRLWRLAKAHLARFGKYQNLDYLGPSHLGEYLRAFRAWPVYPLLLITDVGLVVSSIDIALTKDKDNVDDNNHVMALVQASQTMPTPISWLATRLYKKYRPINFGNEILGESDPVQGALSWYHRAESGGNPFISEMYRSSL